MSSAKILSSPFPTWRRLKNGLHQLGILGGSGSFHDPHRKLRPCDSAGGELCREGWNLHQHGEKGSEGEKGHLAGRRFQAGLEDPLRSLDDDGLPDEISEPCGGHGRNCFSGSHLCRNASYSNLEKDGIQWPLEEWTETEILPCRIPRSLSEQPDDKYPLWIIPRGFHYHYGIGTTIKRAKGLAKVYPDSCVEVHPEDATQAGLKDGDRVKVISPRGEVETICRISGAVPKGVAYFATTFFPVFVNNLIAPVVRTTESARK